jgi:hypothetical protein
MQRTDMCASKGNMCTTSQNALYFHGLSLKERAVRVMEIQRGREQGGGVVASRYTYVLKGGQGKDETCYASTSSSSTARGVPWTPGTNQVRPKLAVASCHVRDATQQQPDRVLVVAHLCDPFGLS